MWSLFRIILVGEMLKSMGLWRDFLLVLLGENIPYCKLSFSISNVRLRCGLPLNKCTLVSVLKWKASSIGFAL